MGRFEACLVRVGPGAVGYLSAIGGGFNTYPSYTRAIIDFHLENGYPPCFLSSIIEFILNRSEPGPHYETLHGAGAYVFVDSGGFSVGRRGLMIDASQVYGMYHEIAGLADYYAFYDQPYHVFKGLDSVEENRRYWELSLRLAERSLNLLFKIDPPVPIVPVLHGFSPSQLEAWYRRIVEPLLDAGHRDMVAVGGVVPLAKFGPELLVYYISFLHRKGHQTIHLFGTAPNTAMLYAASHGLTVLTDSSAPSFTAQYGRLHFNMRIGRYSMRVMRRLHGRAPRLHGPLEAWYRRRYGRGLLEALAEPGGYGLPQYVAMYALEIEGIYAYLDRLVVEYLLGGLPEETRELYDYAWEEGPERFWRRYCHRFPRPYSLYCPRRPSLF